MLTIDGKKISLSKGDTFDVTFAVNGYRLKDGDSVIFSIKNTANSSNVLMKKIYTTFINNKVRVQISAEEMESLTIVRYDSDKDTQLTMQGIALNVSTERFKNEYPDGCPVRGYKEGETVKTIQYLNASQVYTWCADLSSHVGACKQQGWSKQAEVAAALSKEELDAITLD